MRKIELGHRGVLQAEPLRQRHDRPTRSIGVQLHLAAEEIVGRDVAQNQVGVGHRRIVAATVAGRPRVGASARRADAQQAERVDLCDRSAAGTDAGDVDHLDGDALVVFPMLGRRRDLALVDQANVETGAPHVDREQMLLAQVASEIHGSRRRGCRSRMQQKHRTTHALRNVLHQPVGEHHQEGAAESRLLQHAFERSQVAGDRRADIGADGRGVEPFELAPDRQRLVRRADENLRRNLAAYVGRTPLMRRIGVGVQEANGDRFHPVRLQLADRVPDFLFVERSRDAAVEERALLDADASPARDQRLVGRNEKIVERDVDRLDAAPDLDAVAEAPGRDHAGLGAAPGQQDVGGERGAVHQNFDLAEKLVDFHSIEARRLLHRVHQADRRIARCRRGLEFLQQPRSRPSPGSR